MRFGLRAMMKVEVVIGLILGLFVHIEAQVRAEPDYALPILLVEALIVMVFVLIAIAIFYAVHVVRKDQAYVVRLRHNDVPAIIPIPNLPQTSAENR
jgi:hypothetical protein